MSLNIFKSESDFMNRDRSSGNTERVNKLNYDLYHLVRQYDQECKTCEELQRLVSESEQRIEQYKDKIRQIRKDIADLGGTERVIFIDPADDVDLR